MADKALITGGAGFIGSHLADLLVGRGHEVVVIDNLSTGKRENVNPKAAFHEIDISSPNIGEVFAAERPKTVFHLAAQVNVRKSVDDPVGDASINILGSVNVLEACRKNGVERVVFASSGGAVYGDTDTVPTPEKNPTEPASPYGIGKLAVEKYLQYYRAVHGLPSAAMRFANVYGPRQDPHGEAGVVAIFAAAMLRGADATIYGDGEQTRDFVFVKDVVAAVAAAAERGASGPFNVGCAKETTINALAEMLAKIIGGGSAVTHAEGKAGEQRRSCLAIERSRRELGWSPAYDLRAGLEETVEWFKGRA